MRRVILSLSLSIVLGVTPLLARNWVKPAEKVLASLVYIQHPHVASGSHDGEAHYGHYVCTGFSINKKKGYVLTAHHCKGPEITVDGNPATILFESVDDDLLVLSSTVQKPALRPSARALRYGLPIAAMGYGLGWHMPMLRTGVISLPGIPLDYNMLYRKGLFLLFDNQVVGGMSGGPVFDQDGGVVSMVQLGDRASGLSRPISVILFATRAYWEN